MTTLPSDGPQGDHRSKRAGSQARSSYFSGEKSRPDGAEVGGGRLLQRSAPHSEGAERGVLASILHDPDLTLPDCIDALSADAFHRPAYRVVYETLVEMYDRHEIEIDIITLVERLRSLNRLEIAGGPEEVSDLPRSVPTAANLPHYIKILNDLYKVRRLIRVSTDIVQRCYEPIDDVRLLLDEAESDIFSLVESDESKGLSPIKNAVKEAILNIEKLFDRRGEFEGIPTGFTHLDKLTGGFLPGQMIVLAARPSVGKTSLAMNMVENMALDHGIPVAVFSLEMSREQLARRLLCSRAGVNLKAVRDGFIGKKDFLFLAEAANEFSEAPIFIDDTPALTIMELRARSRRLAQKHKVGMVVIDYLQLLRAEGRKIESRQQEIATISSGIKALAKELEVPILVLSQLNREVERRGEDATPRLSDLRESGSIEQDADVVALLVRRVTAPEPNQEDERHKAKLILAKQRSGPTGTVLLTFRLELTRYENFIPDDRGAEGMDLRSDVDNES